MLIQKIFHVHHNVAETKARMAEVSRMRQRLDGVKKAVVTDDGVAQFECEPTPGFLLHAVLVQLPTEDSNQILFQSTVGNIRLQGLLEFVAIRPKVTEVQLVLEYAPKSPLRWLMDLCTRRVEKYIDHCLREVQACVNGSPRQARVELPKAAVPMQSSLLGVGPQFAH